MLDNQYKKENIEKKNNIDPRNQNLFLNFKIMFHYSFKWSSLIAW